MLKTGNHYYYLMHKNERAAVVEIDPDTGNILGIGREKVRELLPVGAQRSDGELRRWWRRRAIPATRNGIQTMLQRLELDNTESLLIANLGLSLTDHYWMKPTGSDLTWETVNLYENEFSDAIGEFLFTGKDDSLNLHGKTMFLPSASLQGELKKKWLIDEDHCRYLVKGNYAASCQQSINEVFATKLHQLQAKVPYTEYRLVRIDTKEGESLGCVSKNFSSYQYEFIPAYEINSSGKKKDDCSEYEFFIQNCAENGLQEDDVRRFLEYQILTDFLLTNTDRHFNNFGVLRDSDTLKFVAMAPIFDSGNSMFWNMPHVPQNEKLLDIRVTSFKGREIELLDYVQDPEVVNVNRLPDTQTLRSLYAKDTTCSADRLRELEEGWKRKIEHVEELQQGRNIKRERFVQIMKR